MPLPTYPFEPKRHWVEPRVAAPPTEPVFHRSEDVDDWLFSPTWTRDSSAFNEVSNLSGAWLVSARRGTLANSVVTQLRAAGADPILLEPGDNPRNIDTTHFQVRPREAEDIAAVVDQLRSRGRVEGAIYIWNADDDLSDATHTATYDALVALAQGLGPSSGKPARIIVATFGAESVLDEPVFAATSAVVLGPVLVLPTELPGLQMRAVDFDVATATNAPDSIAKSLVQEAASGDEENIVARRAGRRWVRQFERLVLPPAETAKLPLKPRGTYLITGGLGGIGLTLGRWLASQTSARLLLTRRTPFPAREQWNDWLANHNTDDQTAAAIQAIGDIEAAGGEVLTAAADAADAMQMKHAIDSARLRWGEFDGVIHAAGTPGSGELHYSSKQMK